MATALLVDLVSSLRTEPRLSRGTELRSDPGNAAELAVAMSEELGVLAA
jgi:hypothetical protein